MDAVLYAMLKNKITETTYDDTEIRQELLKVAENATDMNSSIAQNTNNIEKKLDKNQGASNSGKITGINESGDIVPMFPQGVTYNEDTQCLEYGADEKLNLNAGIQLDDTLSKVGYAADAASVGELKGDIDEIATYVHGINLTDPHDENITENATLKNDGSVLTGQAGSYVTGYIDISRRDSDVLRSNQAGVGHICQFDANKEFISGTYASISITKPVSVLRNAKYIRVHWYSNAKESLMVYLSDDEKSFEYYFEPYYELKAKTTKLDGDIIEIDSKLFDITNYFLLPHETYQNKVYNSSGILVDSNASDSTAKHSTSYFYLDRNKDMYCGCMATSSAIFFDGDAKYLQSIEFYYGVPITKDRYPVNAKFVAFSYQYKWLCGDEMYVSTVDTSMARQYCSKTLKRKDTRPRINIYASDTERQIFDKLMDAWFTSDCDVVFEPHEYIFDSIFDYMVSLGWITAFELPIGKNCTYYLNNCTLICRYTGSEEILFDNTNLMGTHRNRDAGNYSLIGGTLITDGLGYVVHDEGSGGDTPYLHTYDGIVMKYISGNHTGLLSKCIGGGTGIHGHCIIRNCVFLTDNEYDNKKQPAIEWHGAEQATADNPCEFKLDISNCYIQHHLTCDTFGTDSVNAKFCHGTLLYSNNKSDTEPQIGTGWTSYVFGNVTA